MTSSFPNGKKGKKTGRQAAATVMSTHFLKRLDEGRLLDKTKSPKRQSPRYTALPDSLKKFRRTP